MFPQELAYFPMRKKNTNAKNKENKQKPPHTQTNEQENSAVNPPHALLGASLHTSEHST